MRGFRKSSTILMLLMLFITLNFSSNQQMKIKGIDPFFTLVSKSGGGRIPDYMNMIKNYMKQIGINLDVIIMPWSTLAGEILVFRDFDLTYLGLTGGGRDPDFTGVYNENGSLNLFGYHTSMDWDEDLGTGINEWYMREGNLIMPPDSQKRIQHYWEWEDYLMDKICPLLPTFTPIISNAYWGNLIGYNMSDGILRSWGKMSWEGVHDGQVNGDELIITDASWSNLNPLFQDDSSSSFISRSLMDTLIWYDADLNVWPHLAKNYTHINDTHVRITIREGVKWGSDLEGNFTNEYLDVKDVYFTLYCWKYISNGQPLYDWLENMTIVDNYTLDLFIDGNSTTIDNEPYAPYLPAISVNILPEHYLNQTQLVDEITPDITHGSWEKFSTHAFGTGLFEIGEYYEGIETILTMKPDNWRLNTTLTSDPALDWVNRFGDFSSGLNQLRIRIIPDLQTSLLEFEAGRVDIERVSWNPDKMEQYRLDPRIELQHDTTFSFGFLGYNMRENRDHIGSREPCPGDSAITKGLAIRKAISYAVNLVEINNVVNNGKYMISHTPLYPKMGIWNNPNIIKYDYNLEIAKYYMFIAGYDIDYTPGYGTSKRFPGFTYFITLSTIICVTIIITKWLKKDRKLR